MFSIGRAIREARMVDFVQYNAEDPKSVIACKQFVGDSWEGRVALVGKRAVYTIINLSDGTRRIVYPGNYIVQTLDGRFDVVGKDVFESDYRLAELQSGVGVDWGVPTSPFGEQTILNLWTSGMGGNTNGQST